MGYDWSNRNMSIVPLVKVIFGGAILALPQLGFLFLLSDGRLLAPPYTLESYAKGTATDIRTMTTTTRT